MATVDGRTVISIDELIEATVVSGYVNSGGQLILVTRGGAEFLAGNVNGGSIVGEIWLPAHQYETGNVVSYAGMLWKASAPSLNKPPFLFTSLWLRLTGEVLNVWAARDPFFDSDTYTDSWDTSLKVGLPTVSLTTITGEYETGEQGLKISCSATESQVIYSTEENIVHVGEVITISVRARVLAGGPLLSESRIEGTLTQNDADNPPTPGATGAEVVMSVEGEQALSEDWETYVFTITCVDDKPRATVTVDVSAGTDSGMTFLIDNVIVTRAGGEIESGDDFSMERTYSVATGATVPWEIIHDKGTRDVNVYTEDAFGTEIRGDIVRLDDRVQVSFYHDQTGLMRVFN